MMSRGRERRHQVRPELVSIVSDRTIEGLTCHLRLVAISDGERVFDCSCACSFFDVADSADWGFGAAVSVSPSCSVPTGHLRSPRPVFPSSMKLVPQRAESDVSAPMLTSSRIPI